MKKYGFDSEKLYRPEDPEMAVVATPRRWAQWRRDGDGPAFIRRGRKVFYGGADLIAWFDRDLEKMGEHKPVQRSADKAKAVKSEWKARRTRLRLNRATAVRHEAEKANDAGPVSGYKSRRLKSFAEFCRDSQIPGDDPS